MIAPPENLGKIFSAARKAERKQISDLVASGLTYGDAQKKVYWPGISADEWTRLNEKWALAYEKAFLSPNKT